MPDRSVTVALRLSATSYLAGMQAAKRATKDLADETLRATKDNHRNLEQVGKAGLLAGGAIAAGLAFAVKASTEFDKSLSGVKAVANATSGEMGRLRQAALDAGAATVFSASDAAKAEAELAKAGVGVNEILGGALRGSLDLAAAGQLDLAEAATIAAQQMNIFKLQGSDVGHIADVLAAGANKSAADVGQLGEALRQGGLVAAQTGAGLEDTVGVLSAFADSALIGSDAGTSLKTMFQRLTPDTIKAQSAMDQIGLRAFDAQGNFVGLEAVAGQLQAGLGKLSQEQRTSTLETIFGADAVRAANVLYEQGASGIADYTSAVNDQGAASRMAATQLDNLAGDLEALKGSIETALIGSGSAGNDSLRTLTKTATGAVNAFTDLPEGVQKAAFWMGAATSATLLTVGAMGTLVPKVRRGRESLQSLGTAGQRVDRGLGVAARAAARASIAFAALAAADAVFNGADSGFSRYMEKIEAGAGDGQQAKIGALKAEMERLRDVAGDPVFSVNIFGERNFFSSDGAAAAADKADALQERIDALRHEMKLTETTASSSVSAQRDLAESYANTLSPAVEDATDALENYQTVLEDTAAIDAYTATAELAKSFKDLSKDIKTAGAVTNEEKITLGGFAREVKSAASAILDQTGSQKKANEAVRQGRKQFEDLAVQAGYSATEARRLARRLLEIPPKTTVEIDSSSVDDADEKVRKLARRIRRLRGTDIAVTVGALNRANAAEYASGGIIPGPPSRSDTVPAWLSTGEFVVNSAATAANRGLLEAINSGGAQRFASGGYVSGSTTTVGPSISMPISVVAPDPVSAGHSVARSVSNDLWAAGLL